MDKKSDADKTMKIIGATPGLVTGYGLVAGVGTASVILLMTFAAAQDAIGDDKWAILIGGGIFATIIGLATRAFVKSSERQ